MQLTDELSAELLAWAIKRLEDISTADPVILADYVVTLIRSTSNQAHLREELFDTFEELEKQDAKRFVDDLLSRCTSKQIQRPQGYLFPSAAITPSITPAIFGGVAPATAISHVPSAPSSHVSRKRTFDDTNDDIRNVHTKKHGDPTRWSARGLRNTRCAARHLARIDPAFQNRQRSFHSPAADQDRVPIVPLTPMAACMAMQAMLASGMAFNLPHSTFQSPMDIAHPKKNCTDYYTKGICMLGVTCPYDHSNEPAPFNAQSRPRYTPHQQLVEPPQSASTTTAFPQISKAWFSDDRPQKNMSGTAIVVEGLPAWKLNTLSIEEDFKRYGKIEKTNLIREQRLAIVNFVDHESASRAWESSKVNSAAHPIKVYWYRPDLQVSDVDRGNNLLQLQADTRLIPDAQNGPEEDVLVIEAVKKLQAERQLVHEARAAQFEQNKQDKKDLDRRILAFYRICSIEKPALIARIAAKEGKAVVTVEAELAAASMTEKILEKTLALKEARGVGIDPDAMSVSTAPNQTCRARGRFLARGRGGYRGRGGSGGATSHQLDNRPRNIAIWGDGFTFDAQKKYLLEVYLKGLTEYESIEMDPTDCYQLIIAFAHRWQAEAVMDGTRGVPGIGKVEMKWTTTVMSRNGSVLDERVELEIDKDDGNGDAVMADVDEDKYGGNGDEDGNGVDLQVAGEFDYNRIT